MSLTVLEANIPAFFISGAAQVPTQTSPVRGRAFMAV